MTLQAIPYALQNSSHSAGLFRQASAAPFQTGGILGVYELAPYSQSSPNMSIQIGPGRAWVFGTQVGPPSIFITGLPATWNTQGAYFVLNNSAVSITVAASDPTNPRIDTVYVAVQDQTFSGSNNQAILGITTGTPNPSPVAPAAPANALVLGYVAVAANATSIVAANVTILNTFAQLAFQPYASAAGQASYGSSITNGASASTSFSLPSPRFSVPPLISLTGVSSSRFTFAATSVSTTSVSVSIGNWSTGAGTPGSYDWLAVQMTPSSAAG